VWVEGLDGAAGEVCCWGGENCGGGAFAFVKHCGQKKYIDFEGLFGMMICCGCCGGIVSIEPVMRWMEDAFAWTRCQSASHVKV
jgi:hypothetical protein